MYRPRPLSPAATARRSPPSRTRSRRRRCRRALDEPPSGADEVGPARLAEAGPLEDDPVDALEAEVRGQDRDPPAAAVLVEQRRRDRDRRQVRSASSGRRSGRSCAMSRSMKNASSPRLRPRGRRASRAGSSRRGRGCRSPRRRRSGRRPSRASSRSRLLAAASRGGRGVVGSRNARASSPTPGIDADEHDVPALLVDPAVERIRLDRRRPRRAGRRPTSVRSPVART